jgi:hypothetical protein
MRVRTAGSGSATELQCSNKTTRNAINQSLGCNLTLTVRKVPCTVEHPMTDNTYEFTVHNCGGQKNRNRRNTIFQELSHHLSEPPNEARLREQSLQTFCDRPATDLQQTEKLIKKLPSEMPRSTHTLRRSRRLAAGATWHRRHHRRRPDFRRRPLLLRRTLHVKVVVRRHHRRRVHGEGERSFSQRGEAGTLSEH